MRNTKGRLDDGNNLVVYIKGGNRNITRVNADRVQKEIFEILQRHVHMEKVGESLRIFCKNEKEKARTLAQNDIADNEVKVTEPYTRLRTNYTPRGIIFDVDLDMEDEEIRAVTSAVTAKRIEKMVAGQRTRTGQAIVTFEGEELPEFTYMGWRRFRVQTYIPDPIRCYKCQHYGHKAIQWRRQDLFSSGANVGRANKARMEARSAEFARSAELARSAHRGAKRRVRAKRGIEARSAE